MHPQAYPRSLVNHPGAIHCGLWVAILGGADGGGVGQLEGRVHEGTAPKVEAENCEGSSVEDSDSMVCVDRLVTGRVDSRRGHEDMSLVVTQLQKVV